MGNPKFDQISVSRDLDTRAKIEKLARLLTVKAKGDRVSLAQAVDMAVTAELKRRKPRR